MWIEEKREQEQNQNSEPQMYDKFIKLHHETLRCHFTKGTPKFPCFKRIIII